MNKQIVTLLFLIAITMVRVATAQEVISIPRPTPTAKSDSLTLSELMTAISKQAADTIEAKAFAKMLVGQNEIPSIANYASFVPTDGKFALSANYFLNTKEDTTKHKRPSESFAIGVTGAGSVVGGNVATLFEGGKLNTGTDVGLRLSWRMNIPNIGSLQSESLEMSERIQKLNIEKDRKIDSIRYELLWLPDKIIHCKQAMDAIKVKLQTMTADSAAWRDKLIACTTETCRDSAMDSLMAVKQRKFDQQKALDKQRRQLADLEELVEITGLDASTKWDKRTPTQQRLTTKYGLKIGQSLEKKLVMNQEKLYLDKVYEIEMDRPIAGMRLNWLSVVANWNRKSYRTFDSKLDFEEALVKNSFNGHTIGLQGNFYTFNRPFRIAALLTVALVHKRAINLDDLTTSKVVDESSTVHGTVTRKHATEYNVYTDAIETYSAWQLPVDYYRFFARDLKLGWHLFALADLRNDGKQLYNLGTGFIFGLNTEGSKRFLNIELFATYKDLTKELVDSGTSHWKQLQIGISTAIPFMVFKN